MSDVFISYSRHDSEFVDRLVKDLEHAGLTVFFDRRIEPGDSWVDVLSKSIESARFVHPMKFFRTTILLLILLGISVSVFGQKTDGTDGTIFVGQNFSFALKEPVGWVMDSEVARSQGLQAVLYPTGSSWKQAVVVMYARVIHKDEKQATIEKVISNDIDDFLRLSKESTVVDSPSLETRDKKKGISKVFYDAANKNYECVTFIDEPKVVVIMALSSRDKNEYEKSLPAFKTLVSSYFLFTPLVAP